MISKMQWVKEINSKKRLLPEQDLHGAAEGLEVHQVIQGSLVLDMAKDCHSNDCIDESDEGQQGADVEEGWQGDDEGEEELPDSLGGLNESEDPADPEDPNHSEQGRGDWKVGHQVFHQDAHNRGDNKNKIKEIPRRGEVVMTQAYHLHRTF